MKTEAVFSLRVYKDTFSARANEVEAGQTHVVTKHGKPCLVVSRVGRLGSVQEAIAAIRASRPAGGGKLKASIEEGRL